MDPFLTQDDVVARLDSTCVMYRGKAVYARARANEPLNTIRLFKMGNTSDNVGRTVSVDDPDLEVYDFNLGYCQVDAEATYVMRQATRRYKQGICADSLMYKPRHVQPRLSHLTHMMENIYPTYEEALKRVVNHKAVSCAFHRHLCLSRQDITIYLEYKGMNIAYLDSNGKDFVLLPMKKGQQFFIDIIQEHGLSIKEA